MPHQPRVQAHGTYKTMEARTALFKEVAPRQGMGQTAGYGTAGHGSW